MTGLREKLVTTWPVLTETCHLLLSRLGVAAQLAFLRGVQNGACSVFQVPRDICRESKS